MSCVAPLWQQRPRPVRAASPGSWLDADKAKESSGRQPLPLGDTECRLGIISWQVGQPPACPPCPQIPLESIWGVLLHSTDPQGSL